MLLLAIYAAIVIACAWAVHKSFLVNNPANIDSRP